MAEFLALQEIAELLGLPMDTVLRIACRNNIPAAGYLYDKGAVLAAVKEDNSVYKADGWTYRD